MRLLVPCVLLACNDYDLQGTKENEGNPAGDTAFDPGVDTADTGTEADDSGSGELEGDPEVASEPVYLNSGSTLYSYDPVGNVATEIGRLRLGGVAITDMTDIAIDLSGHMYGIAYTELYEINPSTAALTFVGSMRESCNALTFVSDGTLVAACDGGVFVVDPADARTSSLGGRGFDSSGDIVGLPDGYLYWSTLGSGSDDLVRVDPATGATQRLGAIGSAGVYALGYADGDLLAFTSGNQVLVLDTTSGGSTRQQRLAGTWWGATTNPVLW